MVWSKAQSKPEPCGVVPNYAKNWFTPVKQRPCGTALPHITWKQEAI